MRARQIVKDFRCGRGNQNLLVGESRAMHDVRKQIAGAARSDLPVLIEGETGTGKELAAHQLHVLSRRCDRRLVTVDCSTLPENLLECELFGHGKGAFTGANGSYSGRLAEADQGTLFFDEIGNVPLSVQAKLLRFLETGEFPRIRETGLRRVETRVIAATNQSLRDGISDGRVREDFFFRLSALYIVIPPLRERRSDIPVLGNHILRSAGCEEGVKLLEPRALDQLIEHDWVGNVRELKNTLLMNLTMMQGERIEEITLLPSPAAQKSENRTGSHEVRSLRGYLEEKEKEYLEQLLLRYWGNQSELATAADVSVRTLQRKLNYYKLRC